MKKITILIVLVTMTSLAVFAAGSAEDTSTISRTQGRGQYQSDIVISEDITKVTGILKLVQNGHTELIAGNETYELIYPYRLSYDADLKDGMEITVKGFMAENMRFDNDELTNNLMVQSATIDGQTYNIIESMANNYGKNGRMTMNNQRSGSMGGYGAKCNSYNNMSMRRGGRSGRMSGPMGGSQGDYSQNNFSSWNKR